MTRVIVCGSRDWTDYEAICRELDAIANKSWPVLVHGGCPTGADAMADLHWLGRKEVHKADWSKHGRAAGPIRNQEMADLGADLCLAFPLKDSRGTWDMVRRAKKKGIVVRVVQPSKEK